MASKSLPARVSFARPLETWVSFLTEAPTKRNKSQLLIASIPDLIHDLRIILTVRRCLSLLGIWFALVCPNTNAALYRLWSLRPS